MSDDLEVFSGSNGYNTAQHFVRDALRPRALHLVDQMSGGGTPSSLYRSPAALQGPQTWAEEAAGNPAAFSVWAEPLIMQHLARHPPEALVNEVRVLLVGRSFRVSWALFCEEMHEALKRRGHASRSAPAQQRWHAVLQDFSKCMQPGGAWRSREQLLAEARSQESQVSLALLQEAREQLACFRSGVSPGGSSRGSPMKWGPGGQVVPDLTPKSPDTSQELQLSTVTAAAASAAKAAVTGELQTLREELERYRASELDRFRASESETSLLSRLRVAEEEMERYKAEVERQSAMAMRLRVAEEEMERYKAEVERHRSREVEAESTMAMRLRVAEEEMERYKAEVERHRSREVEAESAMAMRLRYAEEELERSRSVKLQTEGSLQAKLMAAEDELAKARRSVTEMERSTQAAIELSRQLQMKEQQEAADECSRKLQSEKARAEDLQRKVDDLQHRINTLEESERSHLSRLAEDSTLGMKLEFAEEELARHRAREEELERRLDHAMEHERQEGKNREMYESMRQQLMREQSAVEILQRQLDAVEAESQRRESLDMERLRRQLRDSQLECERLERTAESSMKETEDIRRAAAASERERARIQNLVRTARLHAAAGAASAARGVEELSPVQEKRYSPAKDPRFSPGNKEVGYSSEDTGYLSLDTMLPRTNARSGE